jgi:hypothetical protein
LILDPTLSTSEPYVARRSYCAGRPIESNGDRNSQESKEKVVRREYTKGDMKGIARSFKGENTDSPSEADQKDGRFIASEGTQAQHQPRASQIAAEHPISGTTDSSLFAKLIKERCWIATHLGTVVSRDATYGLRVSQPEIQQ